LLDATQSEPPYIDRTAFPTTPSSIFWAQPTNVDFADEDGDAGPAFPDDEWDVRCVLE
jgi:hypothetical protein